MTSRYITVHVGLFGIFVTVLTALLYVACFYEQEWAFDSIHPNTQHAPTSCDIVKILGLITSEAPYILRVLWRVIGVILVIKHAVLGYLYDRVYAGFLNSAALILRVILVISKMGDALSLLVYLVAASVKYHEVAEPSFYVFVGFAITSMSVMLVLEFCAVYTRAKHRGQYNTGSFQCKLVSYLVLVGLYVVNSECEDCDKDICQNMSLSTAFLTLPCYLVFHGTDCLDFIKVRLCLKVPFTSSADYQRVDTTE